MLMKLTEGRQAERKRKCSTVQMTDHHRRRRRGNVANDKKIKDNRKKWLDVCTECVMDLDERRELLIFESILTPFKQSIVF